MRKTAVFMSLILMFSLFTYAQLGTSANPTFVEPECELEAAFWFLEGPGFLNDDALVRAGTRVSLLIGDNGACDASDVVNVIVFDPGNNIEFRQYIHQGSQHGKDKSQKE